MCIGCLKATILQDLKIRNRGLENPQIVRIPGYSSLPSGRGY